MSKTTAQKDMRLFFQSPSECSIKPKCHLFAAFKK